MPSSLSFASSFSPLLRTQSTLGPPLLSGRHAVSTWRPRPRTNTNTSVQSALAPPPTPMRPNVPSSDDHPWANALVGRGDFDAALHAAPKGGLVVVCFIASYCRVCKTLMNKVQRLAEAYPDLTFYTINFATHENKQVCADLEVKLLPTFHFYRDATDVADFLDAFIAGPFGIRRLIERLNLTGMNVQMPR